MKNPATISILIVEDEPLVAQDISIKLQRQGYQVVAFAENALQAIQLAKREKPDLVLMDIILPGGMDGIQAAAAIRQQCSIPVIYLTAYSDQAFLERAKITDPMAYLIKPASERDLHATITLAMYKVVTERYLQEKNLLDATLVSFAEALLVWNSEGRIIRVNQALLALLDYKEHQLLGQDVGQVISLNDAANGQNLTDKLIYLTEKNGRLTDHYALLLDRPHQPPLPVRVSANKISNAKSGCLGFVLQIRDDSERQQQEQALRESEARFQELANNLECIFCLSDIKQQQIIYLSPAYEKVYGWPINDKHTASSAFLNHVHELDREKVLLMVDCIQSQRGCDNSFRIIRPDGAVRWVRARCYPINKPDTDQVYRIACILDDVTARVLADIKLQQAAMVFENTMEGILITDAENRIIAVNNALTNITGYQEAELLGNNPRIFKSGDHDASFYQNMWRSIDDTGHWQGEINNRRRDGEIYPQWMTVNTIYDEKHEVINYVSIFSDISRIKESQNKLEYLAHYDHLTGFANRLLFNARLQHAIEMANRNQEKVTILLMDLDLFKDINDSLGHLVGDQLLKLLADRLKLALRTEDTLARLGGDEFVFILENISTPIEAQHLAEKIQAQLITPFILEGQEILITASMGISVYPDDGRDVQALVKNADTAMYSAKQQGKNRFAFFSHELNRDKLQRLTLSTEMRQGLNRDEFFVQYQPQVCLSTDKIVGAEALVRWMHPEKGLIPPVDFIGLAEETGFIDQLGEWVMLEACRQCKAWHEAGLTEISVAVNLSARQFMYGNIVEVVKKVLRTTELPPQFLDLEITESGLMEQAEQVVLTLDLLKAIGVNLSVDDFGTGYSSLSYLKRFPLDKIKIDRSFVKDIPEDIQDIAITKSIIALSKSLNLNIIAEGVEAKAQQEFLIKEGCHVMQGFFYSRPLSVEAFEALLKNEKL
jgi:diguanylate cyclase (GGDEF)-like protein/PAS domain S-box-containing protein